MFAHGNSNCLVADDRTVKLSDFGMARDIHYSGMACRQFLFVCFGSVRITMANYNAAWEKAYTPGWGEGLDPEKLVAELNRILARKLKARAKS